MGTAGRILIAVCFFLRLTMVPARARADVGLIVETPTGILGFLSDVGHSSVWISHGCLSKEGEVGYCENSAGIVLTSTAYWPTPGAAAIPAELFFLGVRPGTAGRSSAAWTDALATAYPGVDPRSGRKYLGRLWRRGMRVTTFSTTAEQDRRVLAEVEQQRRNYRYSYSHRNCAFYAQQILRLYLGADFHANRVFDLGVDTPRSLERALIHRLDVDPTATFRTVSFRGTLLESWRQPPRTFCETAVFDPKYAIPLLVFQPYVYAGFAVCYGVTRFATATWNHHPRAESEPFARLSASSGQKATGKPDERLTIYQSLTGTFPANSQWLPTHTAPWTDATAPLSQEPDHGATVLGSGANAEVSAQP